MFVACSNDRERGWEEEGERERSLYEACSICIMLLAEKHYIHVNSAKNRGDHWIPPGAGITCCCEFFDLANQTQTLNKSNKGS